MQMAFVISFRSTSVLLTPCVSTEIRAGRDGPCQSPGRMRTEAVGGGSRKVRLQIRIITHVQDQDQNQAYTRRP